MPAQPDQGFLNVDLELGARTQTALAPVINALSPSLFELYRGREGTHYRAHFEISGCWNTANETIDELLAHIERFDAKTTRAWKALSVRDFNIGVELAPGVRSIELALAADIVARVAAVGARFVFTAYQVREMTRATARASRSKRSARSARK